MQSDAALILLSVLYQLPAQSLKRKLVDLGSIVQMATKSHDALAPTWQRLDVEEPKVRALPSAPDPVRDQFPQLKKKRVSPTNQ